MELKACPFCGCDKVTPVLDQLENDSPLSYVQCNNCLVQGPLFDDVDESAKRWNTRANNPDTARLDWLLSTDGGTAYYWAIERGQRITREYIDNKLPK